MTPTKIERVFHYEGGMERRSFVMYDEDGKPVKPEGLSKKASKEWDKVWDWFEKKGMEHLLDGSALRDHCLSVCHGDRKECIDRLNGKA